MTTAKRIMSCIMAVTSAFSMKAMTGNAIAYEMDRESMEYNEWFEGCFEIDDSGFLEVFAEGKYKAYYNEENKNLLIDQYRQDYFTYTVPDDENSMKAIGMAMQYAPKWNVTSCKVGNEFIAVTVYITKDSDNTLKEVTDFSKALKEAVEVTEFSYYNNISSPVGIPINTDVLEYYFSYNPEFFEKNGCETIVSYVESLGMDYKSVITENTLTLIPNKDSTVEERLGLMKNIRDKFGLSVACGSSPTDTNTVNYSTGIDLLNNLNGDSNCDGEVGIADAVKILQYLANSEKYPLSKQGGFNADVYGDYDGISGLDAVKIQMFDAGSVIEL